MELQKRQPRVLAVDDDLTSLVLFQESLQPAGFIVDEADSGKSAISRFKKHRPDIVLMDVVMPVMSGYQACEAIRKLPGGLDVPIVMVTGLDDLESIQNAYEAGATDFITKPLNWPILKHRLFYILRANNAILALRKNEQLLSLAQRIAQLGSWEWHVGSNELSYSEESARIFCIDPNKAGVSFRDVMRAIHPEDRRLVYQAFTCLSEDERNFAIEHRINMPDHSLRYVNLRIELVGDVHDPHFTGTVQDITASKKTEEQIRQLAYYDPLTGLPNRRLFRTQLERAIDSAERESGHLALLFIDIDKFKQINDTLGHDAGDQLLTQFSERLKQSTRKADYPSRDSGDSFNVEMSRLGGDEFTVMLTNLDSPHAAGHVAQRLLENMREAFTISGAEIFSSVSIGISLYPGDGKEIDTLIKCADIAMYHAKASGRNIYHLYDDKMNNSVEARLKTENKILEAINNKAFEIYYQPRFNIATGKLSGLEALLRWPQADGSITMPNEFIPIAEENKLIIPLGNWVVRSVIQQIKTWQAMGINDIPVAVNVSGYQLIQADLAQLIPEEIGRAGIPGKSLELEITESILIEEPDKASKTLDLLRNTGVRISVDNFGSGYSSMTTLRNFPLDILKIDRSFIPQLPNNSRDIVMIKTIIAMARNLEMEVIAKGVETEAQLAFYREHHCQHALGFLFSPAVPAENMTKKLLEAAQE
ncbi:MAG TPA: EAL domain-containing protein [Gammaproteobacteria bacterium]|nr:EAL domain-containing protein [Gammaproteobacteria bacterium]